MTPLTPKQNAHSHTQAVFPGRLELVVGDSRETVPAYAMAEETAGRDPQVCDVVFVDGDHSEEGAYADLVNFQALTNRYVSPIPRPQMCPLAC